LSIIGILVHLGVNRYRFLIFIRINIMVRFKLYLNSNWESHSRFNKFCKLDFMNLVNSIALINILINMTVPIAHFIQLNTNS
jgi:hypothetical protein